MSPHEYLKLLVFSGFISFVFSCANVVSPSGGPKDELPPAIEYSEPPNFSTDVKAKEIEIGFDEFISLDNPAGQIIISPPLPHQPDFSTKGKKLFIEFKSDLDSNTTYTINFGESIKDITEGNSLSSFQFVFSTGAVLDSLSVAGIVTDAFDNQPVKDVLVMLYNELNDSVIYKKTPYYFTKTGESGRFLLKNLKAGVYKVFALKDENFDYLYDLPNEKIGFLDSNVSLIDSTKFIRLRIFQEEHKRLQLIDRNPSRPGVITLYYSNPVAKVTLQSLQSPHLSEGLWEYNLTGDTINYWYEFNDLKDQDIIITANDTLTDSLQLTMPVFSSDSIGKLAGVTVINKKPEVIDLNKPLVLVFNRPIEQWSFDKVQLLEDSVNNVMPVLSFTGQVNRKLKIDYDWRPGKSYHLNVFPGAFTDHYGLTNDTMVFNFQAKQLEDYGSLTVLLTDGDSKTKKILHLLDENGKLLSRINVADQKKIEMDYLNPGNYRVKVIFDRNGNGKWDTGNYALKQQPEKVYLFPDVIELRANWEMEVEVVLE